VVDPGFTVDPGDWDTPDQPHNPNQPRKSDDRRIGERITVLDKYRSTLP
jgi:hypothetical protein